MIPPILVLLAFPFVSLMLCTRFGLRWGVAATIVLGFLFLPSEPTLNLPLLPTIHRNSLYIICAAIFALVMVNGRAWKRHAGDAPTTQSWLPKGKLANALMLAAFASSVMTVLTNRDGGFSENGVLEPMILTDIGFLTYETMFPFLLLLLGRRLFSDDKGLSVMLKAVAIGGVAYAALIAFEARVGPMLKHWVYGIWDINWIQVYREFGWRPIVFMQNGLQTALFQSIACVCAVALYRYSSGTERFFWRIVSIICLIALLLTVSYTAIFLGFGFAIIAFFLPRKQTLTVLALVGAIAFTYPILRAVDVVPTNTIVSAFQKVSVARANSLEYRFDAEDLYSQRAWRRPWWGWGTRLRDIPRRDQSANRAAVADAYFVLIFSQRGLVAYFALFGLLTLPLVMIWRKQNVAPISDLVLGAGLATSVAVANLLTNAQFNPIMWVFTGALLGRTELVFAAQSLQDQQRRAALALEREKRRRRMVDGKIGADGRLGTGGRRAHLLGRARRS